MATSRTGTATWKAVAKAAKKRAQSQGQDRCPYCKVILDYESALKPNGAWVDHVIPHSRGGRDTLSNSIVCCRTCNISKGNRDAPKRQTIIASQPIRTSRNW